jgi:Ca2+:H+ antiporter
MNIWLTFDRNAVEMIVAIIALAKGEITVVQTSLIGSILSNLLLVLGMCFFFGGLRRKEQFFNQTIAQTAASLLALAIGSVIIPTAFNKFSTTSTSDIAQLSRGTAIILLVVYAGYLFFQLNTHSDWFNEESQKVAMKPRKNTLPEGAIAKGLAQAGALGAGPGRAQLEDRPPRDELINLSARMDADEPEEAQLHIMVSWATLAISTAIIGLCSGMCFRKLLIYNLLTSSRIHGRWHQRCNGKRLYLRRIRWFDLASHRWERLGARNCRYRRCQG